MPPAEQTPLHVYATLRFNIVAPEDEFCQNPVSQPASWVHFLVKLEIFAGIYDIISNTS